MATAKINGLSLAYETIGEGRPWAITPGGRFTKESPGVRELAAGVWRNTATRSSSGTGPIAAPSDVCFEGSSESAMQADALAGLLAHLDMNSGRHRRRLRRRPGLAPDGRSPSRVGGRPRHLVDQRWRLRPALPGDALLRRIRRRGVEPRDGSGGGPAGMGGGPGAESLQSGALPEPGPGDVHLHDGDAGCWPTAPATASTCPGLPDADARSLADPCARLPQRGERRPPHPGHLGGAGGTAAARAAWSSRRGGTGSGSSARAPGRRGSSPTGPVLAPQLLEWQAEVLG